MDEILHPSLAPLVADAGMDPNLLQVGVSLGTDRSPRGSILLIEGERQATWQVPSLQSLFRGTRVPPDLTTYPAAYVPAFFLLERHVLAAVQLGQVPTDAELDEAFANLRRRPDGRSFRPIQDLLWRASALTLGRFVLSETEYCAIVGRHSRSAGGWKRGPSSREYIGYLARTFG